MSERPLFNPATEADWQRVVREFGTTRQRVAEDVALLKQWIAEQPHLPQNVQEEVLIQGMLIRSKFSLQRTKEALDNFFTTKSTEFFLNRDPTGAEINATKEYLTCCCIPRLTKDGDRIMVIGYSTADPTNFSFESFLKLCCMIADIGIQRYEVLNIREIVIIDYKNITTTHLTKISLVDLKKMEVYMLKVYRLRMKAVHIINAPSFINILMSMIKTVFRSKMVDRMHIHDTLESLHQHVDPELLPAELGGTMKTVPELYDSAKNALLSSRDWFLEKEVLQRVDESKRVGESIDTSALFGMVGTFKTITVD